VAGGLERHKHLVLLAVMLAVLVTQPLLAYASTSARVAYALLVVAAAVVVLRVVLSGRRERWLGAAFAVPAFALTGAAYAEPTLLTLAADVAAHLAAALFLGFAVGVIVRDIFRRRAITFDQVLGAFAGYLILGVVWSNLYAVVELVAPGSFAVNPEIRGQLADPLLRRALFSYVSFSVMASLGYSDVTTVAPLANTLTWLEVMTAQFYLAVVIAQIVGMKLAQVVDGGGPRAP
jgi:hypothetical protein